MARDGVLKNYATRIDPEGAEADLLDQEVAEDLGCFGWLRGARERAVMLVLRKKSGDCLALSYGFIERIEFNPSEGIAITTATTTVQVKGRNLNSEVRSGVRLFEQLTRHRVGWIQEVGQAAAMQVLEKTCVVESLSW